MEHAADRLLLESSRTTLEFSVQGLRAKYFQDSAPAESLSLSETLDGPSCYVPQANEIILQAALSKYPKLCRVLILHELIHSKLYRENGDPDEAHGERFQAEVKRLWGAGAYAKVL